MRTLGEVERQAEVGRNPALVTVESALYRPAEQLCFEAARKVKAGASIADVTDDPLVRRRVDALLGASSKKMPSHTSVAPPALPTAVTAYLARKAAAAAYPFEAPPRAGQIVCVESLRGPEGPIDEDLARPLCAVIDLPMDVDGVWWGWMVGSEPDYACEWDFVLGAEDEPRDPIAATVQLWNPVRVYLPSIARVIGQLTPARHTALRSLVADFLAEPGKVIEAPAVAAKPAAPFLATRATAAGLQVTTGIPITAEGDPRSLYQTLYEGAADVLQLPAYQAAQVAERAEWLVSANVQTLGVYRFLATAAHDPELTLELEFQLPGTGDPLVLMQKRGAGRHDTALLVGRHRIEFAGGIAVPSREVAAELVRTLGLPQAFADWAATGAEFARSRGATTAPMRAALASLFERAKACALAPFDVMYFGFPQLATAQSTRSQAVADAGTRALVTTFEPDGSGARVTLVWLGQPPQLHEIAVKVEGSQASEPPRGAWIESPTTFVVEGLDASLAWVAEARCQAGVLHLSLRLP